jgi:hypothetical protein
VTAASGRSGAIRLLAEVEAAGIRLRLEPTGTVHLSGLAPPPAEVLDGLRAHRAEIVALLRGDACRHCGGPIDWTRPGGVVFDDGRSAHLGCYERVETERQAARDAAA